MEHNSFKQLFSRYILPALPKHDVIVMDNVSFHHKKRLNIFAHKAHRTLVFLPPCSPEPNPIEYFWNWLQISIKKMFSDYLSSDDVLYYIFQVN